jgi:hypothetical protein
VSLLYIPLMVLFTTISASIMNRFVSRTYNSL